MNLFAYAFLGLAFLIVTTPCVRAQSALAQDQKAEWKRLDAEAESLYDQEKYDQSLVPANKALELAEKTRGADHPDVATSLDRLGLIQFRQGHYPQAEASFQRVYTIREKALGPEDPFVASALNHLGSAVHFQSRYAQAEPLYQRALAIDEKVLGPMHPDVAGLLTDLASLYKDLSRYAEARQLFIRALAIREKVLGPEHPDTAEALNVLGALYDELGENEKAIALYQRALTIWEKALGAESSQVGGVLNNLGSNYTKQAQYAKAEPLLQRALSIDEKTFGPDHPSVAIDLNNLAMVYRNQGQYAKAEALYQRSLAIFEKTFGPEHPEVATSLDNLGLLFFDRKQFAKAEPLLQRALSIDEKAFGSDHPNVAGDLNNLANVYLKQGQYAKAEPLYQRGLAIEEKSFGPLHPNVAVFLNNLAVVYENQGQDAKAEPLHIRAVAITEKRFGPTHPGVAWNLSELASIYANLQRYPEALTASRRAVSILRARFVNDALEDRGGGLLSEQRSLRLTFITHLSVLSRVDAKATNHAVLAAEGFEVSQLARASGVGQSVAQMAARFAARGDALAKEVRARQDTRDQLTRSDDTLLDALSQAPDKRDSAAEIALRKDIDALDNQLNAQNKTIAEHFPQYQALVSQAPVSAAAVQALLHPDEALLVYTVADKQSYAWVVRPDRVSFSTLAIAEKDLDTQVQFLRSKLQPNAQGALASMTPTTSSRLYQAIFAPLESSLVGVQRILVVPEGALQSLPFGVLGAGGKDGAQPEWLARRYAFAVLPSVSALRALRTFNHGEPGTDPFVGFGDPVLNGEPGDQRGLGVTQVFTTRSIAASVNASAGALADVDVLRKAKPLPDTADELRVLSATLHGSPSAVFLQAQATEARVKQMDLKHYRFLAFATHGVIAGQLSGPAEPGLVLTPPVTASALDDGYLSASEVAQLKLNADWVLLSACNTAAPDGTPGAEGLSGLAKAFFYAGSRTLLVSNWPVASKATQVLITTTMKNYIDAPQKGKPEALRTAMLTLMDQPQYSHPFFWAPFSVVGE